MNHLRFTLSIASAGLLVGLAACSHQQQTPATSATSPAMGQAQPMAPQQPAATMAEQYGSAVGQSGTGAIAPALTPQQEPQQPGAMSGQGSQATAGAEHEEGAGMQPSTNTVDVSSLDDSQTAAVLNAINSDAIHEAQLAGNSASTPQVRQFARQVLVTRRNLQTKLDSTYSQQQITPSPNALSNQIESDGQNHLTALQSLRGKDFDRVFMDDQVRAHNNALELLDRAIPNVKDAHLKAQLQEVRTRVDAHLKQAEMLQQQLQQGASNRRGGSHQAGTMNVSPDGDHAKMR